MNSTITIKTYYKKKNSKKKKNIFLLGDFNIDLLKYDKHTGTNEFIDSLSSYMYLPYMLHPTRVTGHSQTIIGIIFSNYVSREAVCGILISTISNHLPKVLFIPSMFSDNTATNRANAMLYKVRDFVNANILKSIYYALFESHINYALIIWGQNISVINRCYILQKKALSIINFKERNAHSSPLFHHSKMIKITGKVKIDNCLFINKYTNNKLPSIFTI